MPTSAADTLILETIERLCRSEVPKYQNESCYNTVPRALFTSFAEAGVAGLAVPESFGGIGASAATSAAVFDTISRHDMGPAIFISVHAMVCGLVARFGSDEQKKSILPKLASGEALGAFALTEPHAGSDAQALSTEAVLRGDSYFLTGSKIYITSAGFADLYVVFARTKDSSGTGISAFIVPASTKGLTIGIPEKKMGCELSPIASLFFDEAEVPRSHLLGPVHEGFKVALSGLAGGRVNIAACANGLSRAALDAALKHLRERKQFGRALAEFQGLQFMVADMHSRLEAARLLVEKGAQDLDTAGASPATTRLSSSVAKCFATDTAMSITTDAVQLLGGAGYIKEYQVERYMREAKMLQIVEGTNQVQRMIIARELLE
jgi:alkylation response protein AidB-like acyl-CoA dehydrogenase